jgi:hypothetical protein
MAGPANRTSETEILRRRTDHACFAVTLQATGERRR